MTIDQLMSDAEHSDVILDRLLSLHPKRIDLSLGRLDTLLTALGRPERRLPKVIHVAGTNGKGSVCAFIRAGLEASGARVHVYTSPHLTRFHERIRVAGSLIDEGALAELLARAEAANAGRPITFFEITTAAAFLAFSETPADWVVLEVGLGGRLDATNMTPNPALTVITPVSLDHQEFLGETLAEIATEKAGILKPGAPCIVGPQAPQAMAAIETAADRIGAPLLRAGREWSVRSEHGRVAFEDADGLMDLPRPRLTGRHQIENAGVAAAALRALNLSDVDIAAGFETVSWPARLQRLRRGPLAAAAEDGVEVWLDGGHNAAAAAALAEHMAGLEEEAPAPLYLVCGMISSKDPEAFLRPFVGLARRVYGVDVPGEAGARPAQEIAEAAVRLGLQTQTANSVDAALRAVQADVRDSFGEQSARVLICGSLYLAGRVLRDNG